MKSSVFDIRSLCLLMSIFVVTACVSSPEEQKRYPSSAHRLQDVVTPDASYQCEGDIQLKFSGDLNKVEASKPGFPLVDRQLRSWSTGSNSLVLWAQHDNRISGQDKKPEARFLASLIVSDRQGFWSPGALLYSDEPDTFLLSGTENGEALRDGPCRKVKP